MKRKISDKVFPGLKQNKRELTEEDIAKLLQSMKVAKDIFEVKCGRNEEWFTNVYVSNNIGTKEDASIMLELIKALDKKKLI